VIYYNTSFLEPLSLLRRDLLTIIFTEDVFFVRINSKYREIISSSLKAALNWRCLHFAAPCSKVQARRRIGSSLSIGDFVGVGGL
jgi:hypothetical protein